MEKKLLISQSLLRLSKSKRKVMKHKTYLFHWRRGKKFASEHNGEGEVTIVTGFLASLHLSQNQCDSIEKATRAQRLYRMGTEKERKDKCLKISWGSYQSENNYGWTQKRGQDQTPYCQNCSSPVPKCFSYAMRTSTWEGCFRCFGKNRVN